MKCVADRPSSHRSLICSLSPDFQRGSYSANQFDGLSRARRRVLQLCKSPHARCFNEFWTRMGSPCLQDAYTRRIHVNPSRIWAPLASNVSWDADERGQPANVLLFAFRDGIAAVALQLEGQALFNELIDFAPCSLGEWCTLSRWSDRQQIETFCRDLAKLGLIALG